MKKNIKKEKLKIYYGEQEIGANWGLAYYYSILENKKEKMKEDDIKGKIYNKITNILPQQIQQIYKIQIQ